MTVLAPGEKTSAKFNKHHHTSVQWAEYMIDKVRRWQLWQGTSHRIHHRGLSLPYPRKGPGPLALGVRKVAPRPRPVPNS